MTIGGIRSDPGESLALPLTLWHNTR
jgi:hypothetical protein